MTESERAWREALWKVYQRPFPPAPWQQTHPNTPKGNLPWNDPAFSERMLREHLDESHGAATRTAVERDAQINWLWQKLDLQVGSHLFDVTCGPALYAVPFAQKGCHVTGVDISPASIDYGKNWVQVHDVKHLVELHLEDIRAFQPQPNQFDSAILLYGQLAVFPKTEAQAILQTIARSLKTGGKLCLELLHPDHIDKTDSNWWFTDNTGLWGEAPFLHLGERHWLEEAQTAVETYHILHLETGKMDTIQLCDQLYTIADVKKMLNNAGFSQIETYPHWDGLPLYDAPEWVVYVATL